MTVDPSDAGLSPANKYPGTELELFATAVHWKGYLRALLAPFLGERVAEIGAGLGGTTAALCPEDIPEWLCMEPDPDLAEQLQCRIATGEVPGGCRLQIGTSADLSDSARFDSVLYIDVLEHIADDAGELRTAATLLAPGGHLIVLSPAHQWLYSPFDKAVGHCRRYSRRSLKAAAPSNTLRLVRCSYLDSVGLIASLANRLFLRQSVPTQRQIRTWDRWMVPMSRVLDRMFCYRVGKSILGIWRKAS